MVDIELLKTFLEVVKTRHFGQAAENLYLTQSAVSARIRTLETLLGVALFTRNRKNIQLTSAGERLVGHADAMLLAWERARIEVAMEGDHRRLFSIAATLGVWDTLLQQALTHLHGALPDLTLRAEVHGGEVLSRKLLDRSLDLALLFDPPKLRELTVARLSPVTLVMVSDRPDVTVREALAGPYVMMDWGEAFKVTHAKLLQVTPVPALYTTLSRVAQDYVLQEGGAAYLAESSIGTLLGKQLYPVTGAPRIERALYAAYLHDNEKEDVIANVLSLTHLRMAPSLDAASQTRRSLSSKLS